MISALVLCAILGVSISADGISSGISSGSGREYRYPAPALAGSLAVQPRLGSASLYPGMVTHFPLPPQTVTQCFQCSYRAPGLLTYRVPRRERYQYQVPKPSYKCHRERVLLRRAPQGQGDAGQGHADAGQGQGDAGDGHGDAEQRLRQGQDQGRGDVDAAAEQAQDQDQDQGQGQGQGRVHSQGQGQGQGDADQGEENAMGTHGYARRCYRTVVYETRTAYRTAYEEKTRRAVAGGFAPCVGPISALSALEDGVDAWACTSNCYTRRDARGNVDRGCYRDEHGVDPALLGCHVQAGLRYCFCTGDHCNGEALSAPPAALTAV